MLAYWLGWRSEFPPLALLQASSPSLDVADQKKRLLSCRFTDLPLSLTGAGGLLAGAINLALNAKASTAGSVGASTYVSLSLGYDV